MNKLQERAKMTQEDLNNFIVGWEEGVSDRRKSTGRSICFEENPPAYKTGYVAAKYDQIFFTAIPHDFEIAYECFKDPTQVAKYCSPLRFQDKVRSFFRKSLSRTP